MHVIGSHISIRWNLFSPRII